ncbi:hypothetical protein ABT024_06840 [Streptomyces sp. NPDC002812]|uniref:hypothetical protein n=1 Tax=Streptomyces sp. NPDC002812 TaxID=3154434 RepID=UPI003317D37E
MSVIPGFLLRHEVAIEAYLGDNAYAPLYAAPVIARAFVDEKTQTVRNAKGEEVTVSTTVWLLPTQDCPPESRVTTPSGRVASVITSALRTGGGLPTPDHREVTLT